MTRLIIIIGAESRQGTSLIEALLEYSNEWSIRAVVSNERAFFSEVLFSMDDVLL